tara:strand:+ start:555 stop:779 length:225 start_codon:yes stop_codon:yes gene_type:complete
MERLIVLNTKGKKCVITKPKWVLILESNIESYKYGFKGYIALTTERWKYPIRIHSVHLQNSRTLKNLKIKFEKL